MPSLRPLFMILSFVWSDNQTGLRLRLILSMICLVLSKAIIILVPIFYKKAVDGLNIPLALSSVVIGWILAYGGARILTQLFSELRDSIFEKAIQGANRAMVVGVFRHLQYLSLRFHLDRKTGGLSRVIDLGTKAVESLMGFTFFNIIPTLLEMTAVCVLLWLWYDHLFAITIVAIIICYVAYTLAITQWRLKIIRKKNDVDAESMSKSVDGLLNFETVKYFGREEHEVKRFDAVRSIYEKHAILIRLGLSFLNMGQGFIISIGLMIVMYMTAQGVWDRTMTAGDFVMINTYVIQLYIPLNILGFAYREIREALVNIEKMFHLLDIHPEIKQRENAPPLVVKNALVEFRNVHFHYHPERPILRGISFDIPAGQRVAIVGPSGAGKSTLSRLLFRFYDVVHGQILIDGQDIRDVDQQSLRSHIGIVPQDTVLFNDTILYNVAYGKIDATEDDIWKALAQSKIDDFVRSLPDGIHTVVGERGLKLSGGEKQRLCIARTILKNPPILVFDEATSALDTHTEKAIQEQLDHMSKNRTTMIIAHRLSTITDCDQIYVIDQGVIAEHGTHNDLLANKGPYAVLWKKQKNHGKKD